MAGARARSSSQPLEPDNSPQDLFTAMARHRVPKDISPQVLAFCRSVVRNANPVYVEVQPAPGAHENECFVNVPVQIGRAGGAVQYGWQIWLWPAVLIEAEFHAVWEDSQGNYLDVTPKSQPVERILFLPDPKAAYCGQQVNNIRKALTSDRNVREFIANADQIYEVMNRGDRSAMHGLVEMPADEIVPLLDRQGDLENKLLRRYTTRNSLCPCGSGLKVKRCHKTLG